MVDWMCDVGEDCKFDHCTLHTAVRYLDQLLQQYSMPKHHLQLLGLCCLNIAGKFPCIFGTVIATDLTFQPPAPTLSHVHSKV